ncbi:MAG: DUF4446 family protein [Candidatus Levybacteria bacterium]|nr:DUF4446 family protein [Candidatus Levybacteria bacterium]
MVPNFLFFVVGFFGLWLLALSVLFWQMMSHYNRLTKGTNHKSLKAILEDLLIKIDLHQKDIEQLKKYCDNLLKDGNLHIQKVGLLRFNPFKDTGGDQSFILSLVDANDNGIIISALYSRSGTRWYAKKVIDGKGSDYELSEEEKKALKAASKKD